MPTLILALPLTRPTAATEFEYVVSSAARPLMHHGTAPLALLPAADTVVLVAPAGALSWHPVRLPPVAAGRMRAALAGLLEDQLLDDPAQLGFALVPGRSAAGEALVVTFDKGWLQAALELFEQAQRPVSRVVPAFAPEGQDMPSKQWHVTGNADDPSLVVVDARGVTCLPLASAHATFADKTIVLDDAEVSTDPAVAALAEEVLGRAVTVHPVSQRLLQASHCEWDLAQFDLALRGGGRLARRWKTAARQLVFAPAWRPARWGLIGLILVQLIGLNAWAWKLSAAVRDKQQRVNTLLTQAFPGVRTVVDAPLQMQRQLALLRQASGGMTADDMEAMLAALGAALPPNGLPMAIDFAPGELTVQGVALAGPPADLMRGKLSKLGYQLRVENDRLLMRQQGRP